MANQIISNLASFPGEPLLERSWNLHSAFGHPVHSLEIKSSETGFLLCFSLCVNYETFSSGSLLICALPELFNLADVALFEERVGVVVDAQLLLAGPDPPELWCLGLR